MEEDRKKAILSLPKPPPDPIAVRILFYKKEFKKLVFLFTLKIVIHFKINKL